MHVFLVPLCGVKTWILTQNTAKKFEAFETWVFRLILKISWPDRVINIQVLNKLNRNLELTTTIKRRKMLYFGHVMSYNKYNLSSREQSLENELSIAGNIPG